MFSLVPDDPKKALLQTTGIAILAGADPGQALTAMSSQLAQLKQQAEENMIRRQQLGISQAQLKMQQEEADRNRQIFEQKAALGKAMQPFDLNPSSFGGFSPATMTDYSGTKPAGQDSTNWSANDMVQRQYKGDAAMPIGQEGNPMAKKIMQLPLSVRQGLANAPQAAAEILSPGLTQGMTDIFTNDTQGGKTANVINLSNGTETKSFDVGDPTQRQQAQQALSQGWVEVNPASPGKESNPQIKNLSDKNGNVKTLDINNPDDYKEFQKLTREGWIEAPTKTVTEEAKDPNAAFNAPYDEQIKAATTERAALDKSTEDMVLMGSLLLRPDIYSGAGGTAVNAIGKTLQDTMGLFKDVDFSAPVNAEKMRKSIALGLKQTLMKGDNQMSNSDRKYIDNLVVGMGDGPDAISRGIAMKLLEARYAAEKEDFLQSAIRDQKMNSYQAIQAWNKQKSTALRNIFNDGNINAIMTDLKDGANDQSLVDYANQRVPAAINQAEGVVSGEVGQVTGNTPQNNQDIVVLQGSEAEMQKQWESLRPGMRYKAPDGSIRVRQ